MAQNNKLKTYIRIDGNGRDVSGSNVLRLKMPVTGRWRELPAYECCGPSISIEDTPADSYLSAIALSILCDEVEVLAISSSGSSTTIEEMVAALNANFGYLGTFSTDGTVITLLLHLEIANNLCDGTLTMAVTGTPTTTTTTTTTTTLP